MNGEPRIAPDTCTIDLPVIDSLSVGMSLRALARNAGMPRETADIYDRFGRLLESAAKLAIVNGGAR